MKKLNLLLFICLLPSSLLAQENSISRGAETITIDELRDHIYYLASDELEGRFPGTSGYEKAIEYVVTQLRQSGLSAVLKNNDSKLSYYQDIILDKYSPGTDNKITIIKNNSERTFSFEDNFLIVNGIGPFEAKEISGELAFVGAGIREPDYGIDDYKNIDVKGKWAVVIAPREELPITISKKLPLDILQNYQNSIIDKRKIIEQNAKDAGAIGIISILSNYRYNSLKRRSTAYHDLYTLPGVNQIPYDISLPFIYIDSSMVDYLFKGEKYNPLRNKESYRTFVIRNSELKLRKEYNLSTIHTANVVALIEGSDPILRNEFITLGAHIDHLGIQQSEVMNGADDNASGSAGVLEIAEALAKSQLKRSVICILYTGEELGLLGSYYFTENPPVLLKDIIVNINLDMIGRSRTDASGLAPVGATMITPKLKEIILNVNNKSKNLTLDWAYADTTKNIFSSSDHYSFHVKKIPAVFFFDGTYPDYHTPADDPEKIDYEFCQKTCKLVYEIIMELANGDINLRD
jgi:hypothetical protein